MRLTDWEKTSTERPDEFKTFPLHSKEAIMVFILTALVF